jgi:hypothetical protein
MDNSPRRLDAIDDELEIGFDERFEKRWHRLEIGSHVLMALFVLAALGGFFGRGPFSHRTEKTADGRLAVDFEPLARWGTDTQVTVHLSAPGRLAGPGAAVAAHLFVSSAVIEPLGLQRVIPTPNETESIGGGAIYDFTIPPGEDTAFVRFVLRPSTVGLVTAEVRTGGPDGEPLSWKQLVLP